MSSLLRVTELNDRYDIDTSTQHDLTWDQLATELTTHKRSPTKNGGAIVFGGFVDGPCTRLGHCTAKCPGKNHRIDDNVTEVSALGLDFDNASEARLLEIRALLKGVQLQHVWYTTHSSTEAQLKIRIVIALSRPVPGADWRRFWDAAVDHVFGSRDIVDGTCANPSRVFYLPCCPEGATPEAEAVEGEPLDVDAVMALAAPEKPVVSVSSVPPKQYPAASSELLAHAREELRKHGPAITDRHNGENEHTRTAWGILVNNLALSEAEAKPLMEEWNATCEPPWDLDELYSGPARPDQSWNGTYGAERDLFESGLIQRLVKAGEASKAEHESKRMEKMTAIKIKLATKEEELRQAKKNKRPAAEIAQLVVEKDALKAELADEAEGEAESCDYNEMASKYADATKHAGILTIRRRDKQWYAWLADKNVYRKTTDEQVEADLRNHFKLKRMNAAKEVHNALKAIPGVLIEQAELGTWISGNAPDMLKTVVLPNGFLDLPSGKILPASPEYFAEHTLDVRFDPSAPMPRLWLQFLAGVFEIPGQPGTVDQQQIDALQEWFGLQLVPDTKYQKAAFLYGLTRAGKGTIQRVLTALLGIRSVCSPKLKQLADTFGLTSAVGKLAAIIGDVRLSKTDVEMIVEPLLATVGEDLQEVNRKFVRDNLITKLSARLTIAANGYPEFDDPSGSIAARMLIFVFKNSFAGREDPDLLKKLLPELPGILNWAIAGWKRLDARGHFVQPKTGENALKDFARTTSPAAAWIKERCEPTRVEAEEAETKAAYRSFYNWWRERSDESPMADSKFGQALKAKGIESKQRRLIDPKTGKKTDERARFYVGLKLKVKTDEDETENGNSNFLGSRIETELAKRGEFLQLPSPSQATSQVRHG
jgi:putative DNA primase/helicase